MTKDFLNLEVSKEEIKDLFLKFKEDGIFTDIELEKTRNALLDVKTIYRGKKKDIVVFFDNGEKCIGHLESPMDAFYKKDRFDLSRLVGDIQERPEAKKIMEAGKKYKKVKRYLVPYEFKVKIDRCKNKEEKAEH